MELNRIVPRGLIKVIKELQTHWRGPTENLKPMSSYEYPFAMLLRLPVAFYRRCNSPLNSTGHFKSLQEFSFLNKHVISNSSLKMFLRRKRKSSVRK